MQEVSTAQIKQKLQIFYAVYLTWLWIFLLFIWSVSVQNLRLFIYALVSGVLARGLNEVVCLFYKKQRPAGHSLIQKPNNLSFPSGHASFLLGISFFLTPFQSLVALLSIIISVIVFSARVYCGVHWKTDILGSLVNGVIAAAIIYFVS